MINRILLLLVLMTTLACGCCHIPISGLESVVSNTETTVIHVFHGNRSCSGFSIGNKIMITAAHCLPDLPSYAIKNVTIDSYSDKGLMAEVVELDKQRDIAVMVVPDYRDGDLILWNPLIDGDVRRGLPVAAFGFPGYYDLDFTFESGYIKDTAHNKDGTLLYLGRDLVYPGESGGPLVSLTNGKVIGIGHTISPIISLMGPFTHFHYDIAGFVSILEFYDMLNDTNKNYVLE